MAFRGIASTPAIPGTPPPPHPQGTPGITAADYVGCSHDALVEMIRKLPGTAEEFLDSLIAVIEEFGATDNQRVLLTMAYERAVESMMTIEDAP